jgi:hypothetical protein
MLFAYAVFRQTVCVKGGFGMVGKHEVFKTEVHQPVRHFFYAVGAIAPVAMRMNQALYIRCLDHLRQRSIFSGQYNGGRFTQRRRNRLEVQRFKKFGFGFTSFKTIIV